MDAIFAEADEPLVELFPSRGPPGELLGHRRGPLGAAIDDRDISRPFVAQIAQGFLAHFPGRSPDQFALKVSIKHVQYLAMTERAADWGYHYNGPVARLRYRQSKIAGAPDTILVDSEVVELIGEQQRWLADHMAGEGAGEPLAPR